MSIEVSKPVFDELRSANWEKGKNIIEASRFLYVEVDIEADGIAGHGSMLSLGAQSITGLSFYREIKPAFETFIPAQKQFCDEHGLQRERLLKEAPDANLVMKGFYEWVDDLKKGTEKTPIFSTFNGSFDFSFVDLYFYNAGIWPNPFGVAPFDLKSLAMAVAEGWDWGQTKSSKLPQIVLPDEPYSHNALKDAQYQQKIHFGLAGILGQQKYELTTYVSK